MIPATVSIPDTSAPVGPTANAPDYTAVGDRTKAAQSFASVMGKAVEQAAPQEGGAQTTTPEADGASGSVEDKDRDTRTKDPHSKEAAAALACLAIAALPVPPPPPTLEGGKQKEKPATVTGVPALLSEQIEILPTAPGDQVAAKTHSGTATASAVDPNREEEIGHAPPVMLTSAGQPAASESVTDVQRADESDRQPQLLVPVPVAGTSGAIGDGAMKTQGKVAGNTRSAEKMLPRGQVLPEALAREPNLTGPEQWIRPVRTEDRPARGTSTTENTTFEVSTYAVAGERALPAETTGRAEAEGVGQSRAEKLSAAITERVVAFKRTGTDSLDVSLRPDRGTEISLHLSLRNGQVEVAARLERGNFESFQVQWSGLQQSLSQQGIRVGQLVETSGSGQTFSQPSSGQATGESPQQQQQSPERFDELTMVGAMTEPLKGRSVKSGTLAYRGWEMWA